MFFLSGIILGIVSSLHCLGMCGPIALALPVPENGNRYWAVFLYNGGRTITYAAIGAFVGLAGFGIRNSGVHQYISIISGVLIIMFVVFPAITHHTSLNGSAWLNWTGKLKEKLRYYFGRHSYTSLFFIGLLNGLLPCGMVYVALAASLAGETVTESVFFMAGFGMGTIPLMASLSLLKSFSMNRFFPIRKIIPVFSVILALLLILRGLSLGIPYVSPAPDNSCCAKTTTETVCH